MSVKEKFTEEEWHRVIQSPMLAGVAITAADPGGLWSTIRESASIAKSLYEAQAGEEGSLPEEIGASFEVSEQRNEVNDRLKSMLQGKKPAEVADAAVGELQQIRSLVEAKAPDQLASYREFVRSTAQRVAEAGTEGGFLGFGGEKVSDAERKTLADIDRALG